MLWSVARVTGWPLDFIRWEIPLVDVLRAHHAELWLEGHTCKRAGGPGGDRELAARFDSLAARDAHH